MNLCNTKFKCSVPYGSPECEFFGAMHTGDCRHFMPRNHQTCFSEKAREAALDKVIEVVRKANAGD